jgi:hypothetical protein
MLSLCSTVMDNPELICHPHTLMPLLSGLVRWKQAPLKFGSTEACRADAKYANQANDDQVHRHNEIEQLGHDQNQDTCQQ